MHVNANRTAAAAAVGIAAIAVAAAAWKGRSNSPPPSPPPSADRLYIALGDSLSAGIGVTDPSKGWVRLYYGYLAATGSVTRLENLAQPGHTTTDLRMTRLPRAVGLIDGSDDTIRVTVNIGFNDGVFERLCESASAPGCPIGDNIRAILKTLNEALARDPGEESIQIMELYNPYVGTDREAAYRAYLLGSDLKVDCSGTGSARGLNDLMHCIGVQNGAVPVAVLPAFDAAREDFLSIDHSHPNDAGHRAIAEAFGGAVERQ